MSWHEGSGERTQRPLDDLYRLPYSVQQPCASCQAVPLNQRSAVQTALTVHGRVVDGNQDGELGSYL